MLQGFSRNLKFVEYQALNAGRIYYAIGHSQPYVLIAAKNENNVTIGIPISEAKSRFLQREISTEGGFLDLGPLVAECSLDPGAFKVSVGHQDDHSGALVVGQDGPLAIALWQAQDRRWYLPFDDYKLRYSNMGSRRAVCYRWRAVVSTGGQEADLPSLLVDVGE